VLAWLLATQRIATLAAPTIRTERGTAASGPGERVAVTSTRQSGHRDSGGPGR